MLSRLTRFAQATPLLLSKEIQVEKIELTPDNQTAIQLRRGINLEFARQSR